MMSLVRHLRLNYVDILKYYVARLVNVKGYCKLQMILYNNH